jgi:hypothetical protein
MPLRRTLTALVLALTLTTGCSMTHGDPKNPKKNPHPVKRYEVIATADAPGPWDSVSGRVFFDVVNLACTPEDKFLGVHAKPQDVAIDFEMTRVDEKTWKGSFYRDAMMDEDYYELGVCHWDATSVSAGFTAQGIDFSSDALMDRFLHKNSQTEYFKKSSYGDRNLIGIGTLDFSSNNSEYIKSPNAFFPITVTVKEVTP